MADAQISAAASWKPACRAAGDSDSRRLPAVPGDSVARLYRATGATVLDTARGRAEQGAEVDDGAR